MRPGIILMIVLSVLNSKGGVGKTTTVTTLATLLAQLELDVLIVDMAPQANATLTFYDGTDTTSVCDFLTDDVTQETIMKYVKPIREEKYFEDIKDNLFIVPGAEGQKLNSIKDKLDQNGYSLKNSLKAVEDYFDVVIIDNDPQLDILAKTSLIASDYLISPIEMDLYSFRGSQDVIKFVKSIKENFNQDLIIKGFLPTKYRETNREKAVLEEFKAYYEGDYVMNTTIPNRVSVKNSISVRLPLPIYDCDDACTLQYMRTLDELDILEKKQSRKLKKKIKELDKKIEDRKEKRRQRRR